MTDRINASLTTIRHELSRLSWPTLIALIAIIIAFGFVGISQPTMEIIVFKFLVFCPALILVHLSRRTLFPYLDLSSLINETTPNVEGDDEGPTDLGFAIKDAATIIGTFAYYIGMTYVLTAVL